MKNSVEIYTDGACRGNPGPGGWGVSLRYNGTRKDMHGGELETTNNRMELMAAITGLEALTRPCKVTLYTDSKYVLDGITSWINNWKQRGWKTANKKPVKNVELWQRLDTATDRHEINWIWVKGHSGAEGHARAAALAHMAHAELLSK